MYQYQNVLKEVLKSGVGRVNRTNQHDRFIPSATMVFDLREGFPTITTKQLAYKQSIGEILGFIRGYEDAAAFRALGCNIWNSDANENKQWLSSPYRKGEDDLGKIYGSTWRKRTVYKETTLDCVKEYSYLIGNGYSTIGWDDQDLSILSKDIDQLHDVIDAIINTPNNRRIIMHAWFPELFDEMALPPCHCLYRFIPDEKNKVLHMSMYQRSCDLLLGVPFNIFGSALVLSLVSEATGYTAGIFTHHLDDVHLYDNAIAQATIQTGRTPLDPPQVQFTKPVGAITTNTAVLWLESITPSEIILKNYRHCGKLERVEMAQEK